MKQILKVTFQHSQKELSNREERNKKTHYKLQDIIFFSFRVDNWLEYTE